MKMEDTTCCVCYDEIKSEFHFFSECTHFVCTSCSKSILIWEIVSLIERYEMDEEPDVIKCPMDRIESKSIIWKKTDSESEKEISVTDYINEILAEYINQFMEKITDYDINHVDIVWYYVRAKWKLVYYLSEEEDYIRNIFLYRNKSGKGISIIDQTTKDFLTHNNEGSTTKYLMYIVKQAISGYDTYMKFDHQCMKLFEMRFLYNKVAIEENITTLFFSSLLSHFINMMSEHKYFTEFVKPVKSAEEFFDKLNDVMYEVEQNVTDRKCFFVLLGQLNITCAGYKTYSDSGIGICNICFKSFTDQIEESIKYSQCEHRICNECIDEFSIYYTHCWMDGSGLYSEEERDSNVNASDIIEEYKAEIKTHFKKCVTGVNELDEVLSKISDLYEPVSHLPTFPQELYGEMYSITSTIIADEVIEDVRTLLKYPPLLLCKAGYLTEICRRVDNSVTYSTFFDLIYEHEQSVSYIADQMEEFEENVNFINNVIQGVSEQGCFVDIKTAVIGILNVHNNLIIGDF